MKFEIKPTEGNALDPHAVKGADDLALNSPFLDLKFIKENPLERAGVILEIEPEAREFLERELRYHMRPEEPNYRAVMELENGLGVQVMINGIATYSNLEQQLFEVDVLRKGKNGQFEYWTDSPFLPTQVGELLNPEAADDLIRKIRAHSG